MDKIRLFTAYKVKLPSPRNNIFFADNSLTFDEGETIKNIDPIAFYIKELGAKKIRIADLALNLSRLLPDNKYVDELDLKIVNGIVLRNAKGDGWAMTIISDESLLEPTIVNGAVVKPDTVVRLHPSLQKYDKDSEIAVVGTVTLNKQNETVINAVYVFPLVVRGETE